MNLCRKWENEERACGTYTCREDQELCPYLYIKREVPITFLKKGKDDKPVKDFGDILYGEEYFIEAPKKEDMQDVLLLSDINIGNPWDVLKQFQIEYKELKNKVRYKCPFTSRNTYYWFVPVCIIIRGTADTYRVGHLKNASYDYRFDTKWNRLFYGERIFELSPIHRVLIGHGYTEGTLPSDGSGDIYPTCVKMSNGDLTYGYVWVWFNK